jgi:FtsP/CotA-like multicopper oxidase with cupredoxin domain
MPWSAQRALVAPLVLFLAGTTLSPAPDSVGANDNRHSVGTLKNGVLTVALEARNGVWHPEGDGGRGLEVAAFAEVGKSLSTPGPLIRVPVGTEVRATVRNRLDKPLIVFGLGKTRGLSDSTIVPPDGTAELRFAATTAGTFYYLAKRGNDALGLRLPEDLQLHGVIVVDPPNAPKIANERVFVISWWGTIDPKSKTGLDRLTMAINGLSWPHTERLDYAQGDSVHFRVVNMTELDHPMHLHGFYFRMDSKGDGVTDSLYTAEQRRMAVTEMINPFQTMTLAWKADRSGNWIYHCHYATHLSTLVALDTDMGDHDMAAEGKHPSDRPHQMYGLVLGIRVAPAKGVVQAGSETPRKIRIIQREKPNVYGSQPGMSFVVDGQGASATDMPVPGPALILERGKPVAVTVVNQGTQPAAVHWHGIELESYPDGVPGWSGSGKNILPSIAPHESLTVRWTPPRAGSFMYHSHFNEAMQMGAGLYGPIIVLEPGEKWNPETDKILFFGTAGMTTNPVFGPFTNTIMNGKTQPDAMNLSVGTRYRFRLFNLAGDTPTIVSINAGDAPINWRAVAKDGYPLPASQATTRPAMLVFDPGEIYDFEYTPTAPGELVLKFGPPQPPPNAPPPPPGFPFQPPPPTVSVPIHVR